MCESRPSQEYDVEDNNKSTLPPLDKYKDLFSGIGCIQEEYDIKLYKNTVPKIHACRKVPIAITPKLKIKLDRLEKLGII